MAKLYEIDEELMRLMEDAVDPETGEFKEEALERIEELNGEKEAKLEGIALWIKNLKSDAAAYKAEKQSFDEKQKAAENKAENLTRFLDGYLGGENFKTSRVTVSHRKSVSVEVTDEAAVPEEYLRCKYEVNKTEIKDALKNGEIVPGCALVEKNNIQIK